MGETGGELKIRVLPANRGKEVVTEIEDTGPGVPADMREQIFNPFVSTKKTGVGLGLAIVSKIIDAHGGTIKLIDPPGRGACFRVTLPAA
jgi:signal transduction histidine kinase